MPRVVDVEELVNWAFEDQKIEAVARRLGPPQLQRSPESSLAQLLALGCRVDTSSAGAMHLAVQCHEDAAVIYDAVMALPPEAWFLVIKHGRNGTQPDWHEEGPGQWVQPLDKNGEPKKMWRDARNRRGYLGLEPPYLVGTNPELVAEARAEYQVWHAALVELVPMLNSEMVDHVADGPRSEREPWRLEPLKKAVDRR